MCTKPLTINGFQVSCRECDQCVSTYKNTWVARCVAEKQTLPHAYAITLTYADVEGEAPLGARVYRYKDVSDMIKRIRSAGRRKWGESIQLRYVMVGEKGTRFGRCHYHGVIFSDYPIVELGVLQGKRSNEFAYKRRLDWSLWGHGFVEFQEADRKGMSYTLKYILKGRMNAAKSKGHKREGKTEWLASSYMWCSKIPPVGATWLYEKLNDLVGKGMSPASLRMRVSGGGDWYVAGNLQKDVCLFLHRANQDYRQENGRDLAGFKTLLGTVREEIEMSDTGELVKRKPWEWLTNGEDEEETEISEEEVERQKREFEEWYAQKRRIAAPITNARSTVRRCGNIVPCDACKNTIGKYATADLEQEYLFRYSQWGEKNPIKDWQHEVEREGNFKTWWQTRLRPSRGCQIRNTAELQEEFRRLIPINKVAHGTQYKAAIGKALQKKT